MDQRVYDLTREQIRFGIDRQVCPFCGSGPFKMLPVHTNKAHGIDKWELRELAGFSTSDPLCSGIVLDAMSDAARRPDRVPIRAKATEASKRYRRPYRWTTAGKQRIAANLAQWEAENPDEAQAQRLAASARSKTAGAIAQQSRSLSKTLARRPDLVTQMVRVTHSPSANAKRLETIAARPLPEHGLVARYKRGCRCDECRAAKRTYRRTLERR